MASLCLCVVDSAENYNTMLTFMRIYTSDARACALENVNARCLIGQHHRSGAACQRPLAASIKVYYYYAVCARMDPRSVRHPNVAHIVLGGPGVPRARVI